jgi:hypothetical protein
MSLVQARNVMVGDQCIIDTQELQRNARCAMLHICVVWQNYQRRKNNTSNCTADVVARKEEACRLLN